MTSEPSPRSGRLQQKIFVALLIVGIVPGVVALSATYLYSIDSLKQSIGSGFQEIARSTALRIAAAVDAEIDRAERLAAVPKMIRDAVESRNRLYDAVPKADRRRMETVSGMAEYLNDWAHGHAIYARVTIADRHGAVVATTDPTTGSQNHAGDLWWQEAMRTGADSAYVSTLHPDPLGDDFVFDVAVPILSPTDETIGVVVLVVKRDALVNTILPIRVGETGHGMLMDTQGTPLICPVLPPTAHLIHDSLVRLVARDEPLWLVADDDAHGGRDSIVGAAPVRFSHRLSPLSLGGTRWIAFVRQPPDETYAPIYALLVTVGMIGFGLVVVLASLGFVVGRKITGPILTLRREADALRHEVATLAAAPAVPVADAVPARKDVRTGDELEDLARTFYAMRSALEGSLRTIKAQQEELIRREKLASVGQLLAALAHDIRNPLGVIRSSAQLVLEEHQSPAVKQEVARYIIEEVDRLAHRINDFLRYARQKPPEPRVIRASALAGSALAQWRAQGVPDGIAVETSYGESDEWIDVDPEQVKEALVNLLVNAREAMPAGGRLSVRTGRVNGTAVEIEVADTGCGIAPGHLERIFEPFYTTKEYGTGLGLTNVKRLIQDNGGTLTVSSEVGTGSRFIVRFRAAERPAAPTTLAPLSTV